MNLVCTTIEPISVRPRGSGDPGAISAFTRVFNALCTQALPSLGPRFRGDERNQEAIQIHLIALQPHQLSSAQLSSAQLSVAEDAKTRLLVWLLHQCEPVDSNLGLTAHAVEGPPEHGDNV